MASGHMYVGAYGRILRKNVLTKTRTRSREKCSLDENHYVCSSHKYCGDCKAKILKYEEPYDVPVQYYSLKDYPEDMKTDLYTRSSGHDNYEYLIPREDGMWAVGMRDAFGTQAMYIEAEDVERCLRRFKEAFEECLVYLREHYSPKIDIVFGAIYIP